MTRRAPDLSASVREGVDAALDRRLAELTLRAAEIVQQHDDARGPLALPGHERRVLAALVDGVATLDDLEGLPVGAFTCRSRGLAYGALRERLRRGQTTDRPELRALLVAGHRGVTAPVDLLLEELDLTPTVLGPPLRRLVLELIAADAWSTFVVDVRSMHRLLRLDADAYDDRRHGGALDGARMRAQLRALAAVLTPALAALEERA